MLPPDLYFGFFSTLWQLDYPILRRQDNICLLSCSGIGWQRVYVICKYSRCICAFVRKKAYGMLFFWYTKKDAQVHTRVRTES